MLQFRFTETDNMGLETPFASFLAFAAGRELEDDLITKIRN